jgi:chromosome segregation ATPase
MEKDNKNVDLLKKKINEYELNLKEKEQNIKLLNDKISEYVNEVNESDKKEESFKDEILEYKKNLNEKDEKIKLLNNKIDELSKQVNSSKNMENKTNILKNENNELRTKLKDLENKYNTVKDELFLTSQTLEENQKKARNIKIDENKNIYFNFLQNDLIKYCQFHKGKEGDLEQLVEKTDEEILKKNAIPLKKTIKNYEKNDIKIDNNYRLCENLKEEDIVPELYNTNEEDIESSVNILSNSLRNSIDKSLNTSLRKSITQSYADGIYDSTNLNESKIKFESGGILSKLNQVFGSVLGEDNENGNEE